MIRSRALFGILLILAFATSGRSEAKNTGQQFYSSPPSVPLISIPARSLPADWSWEEEEGAHMRINPLRFEPDQGQRGTWNRSSIPLDALAASSVNPNGKTPNLDLSFDSTANPTGCGTCSPPDVVGDVGPNHYVAMVNATKIAIFNKSGGLLSGPFNLSSLWPNGDTCDSDDGDPVPVYDSIANRWLLSQFASPNHMCIAISQTADPAGSYFLYTFNVGSFPDYFKFGVWPDGYYMSANESSYTAYAFDRVRMLSGLSATFVKFTGGENFFLPSDVDGAATPPANAPNYFYTFLDNSFHGGNDRIEVRALHADFVTPGNSTFTLVASLNVTAFTYTACGFFNQDCIRQKGTTQRFDSLGEWPLFRFPYRNLGTHETLVGVFEVGGAVNGPGGTGEVGSAPRWFELRKVGAGAWTLFQQGTYDPADGNDRVNPSVAMDAAGNIALGYTASSSAIRPSIRYATRVPSDPPGTLGTEKTLQAGGGSQTGSNRWGDYSAMSVDPTTDCQFWYTNEYYSSSSATSWKTKVGAFTVGCSNAPDLSISKSDAGVHTDAGEIVVYLLSAGNPGIQNATGVTITDVVPANTTFNPASSTVGWVCAPDNSAGSTCTFTIGALNVGATPSANFAVTVDDPLPLGVTSISNTATIADDGANGTDPNPGNNSDSESTPAGPCLFCDDFEDSILSLNWTYIKLGWTETGGSLIGTPTGRKAIAIATPVFGGCSNCSVEASMKTSGGIGNRVWLLGWYLDKRNTMELMMKEENDKWILKERVGGKVVNKLKGFATIVPNVSYVAIIVFNGSQFELIVDGNSLGFLTPVGSHSGTVGFQTKATTGTFGHIEVN